MKLLGLGVLILAAVIISWFVGGIVQNDIRCVETADHRPCFEGTIESDDDGECECMTQFGELEWQIGGGCDLD